MKTRENGFALVVCMIAMLLMMALGMSLIVATSAESMIAGNFRNVREGRYAAEAALERAISDLANVTDWTLVLNGSVQSSFRDGSATVQVLPDGSTLDLAQVVNVANCGRTSACTSSQMDAVTAERPWGTNNLRWRLYAYGPLRRMLPEGNIGNIGNIENIASIESPYFVLVLVADDQSENDSSPLVDGAGSNNPGRDIITLRAESFGPKGAHHGIEATIARAGTLRVLSWRTLARLDRP